MKRHWLGWVIILILSGAGVAFAVTGDEPPADAHCVEVAELGVWVCGTTTTTSSTTTTTTTTLPPTTTTTTVATSTTTTAPPTTTVADPIPPTIDHGGTSAGNAYNFEISNLDTGESWWEAPYHFDLLYEDGYGWAAGDRIAYRCSYGFLVEGGTLTKVGPNNGQWDILNEDTVLGRFGVVRTVNGGDAYIRVLDQYMIEGQRDFDGNYVGDGGQQPSSVCSDMLVEDYEPYTGPDERPVVVFRNPEGEVIEIRDYRTTEIGADIRFRLVDGDGSDGTVAVVAYGSDDLPGVAVYYSGLNGGTVEAFTP